ncbi:MAG TPA: CARDB domain-containing protein [Solirubrobacteraceae bacterium]|nr:CARDB domain-containing protein [Solirubrobacteraceae bacterium]
MTSCRRLLLPLMAAAVVLVAMLAPGAFGAQATAAKTGPTGPSGTTGSTGVTGLVATVSACHTDPVQANRYAIFQSQMTAVPGTRTMAVSFVLQVEHSRKGGFATVTVPGFGGWVRSQPGVGIFTYNHEVTSLPAPAAFRVLVKARWIDRHHHTIRHEDIDSTACVQPLLQPDLAIGEPLAHSAGPGPKTVVYSVIVRNDGTAAASNFQVGLTVNGVAQPPIAVPTLAANSTQLVDFTAPRCTAGTTIVATADVTSAVSEPANASRSRTFACGH